MKIAYCGPISLKLLSNNLNIANMHTDGYSYPFGAYFVKELLHQKHEVIVITSVADIGSEQCWEFGALKVIATPRRDSRKMVLDSYTVERKSMVRALRESGADIVHAQWTYEFCHAARKSGLPYVVTARDAPWLVCKYYRNKYRFFRLIYSYWALFGVKNLTAVSPHIAANFAKHYGFNDNIPVIPNAVPDDLPVKISKPYPGKNNFVLVSISSWSTLKNTKTTLYAFALLLKKYPSAKLRLIGAGLEKNSDAYRWATEEGLSENVEFEGKKSHGEIIAVLKNDAKLFLYSSLEESFCMVVLEAMASGVPVVVLPDTGALPWLIENGKCGEIACDKTPESMTKACMNVMASSEYYERLSSDGLARVVQMFTMRKVIKRYIDTYKLILKK